MKMQWLWALCLALPALQAQAQQSAPGAQTAADAANKAAALKSARISPRERAELADAAAAEQNAKAGADFLAANKAKAGVVSLASGVQYRILKAGNGRKPADTSSVLCRYKGTLIDGSTFDRADDGKPIALRLAGLAPGLKEAVKLMPVGSKWEVVVPPQLGFGARGNRAVGPNAVLIYVVELVGIV
jgi:FKBP-type peptidyl-prolyl cis-trans isomerase FklB